MDAATWARVHAVYDDIVDLDPRARASRLAQLRSVDPQIGDWVHALLEGDAEASARLVGLESGPIVDDPGSTVGSEPSSDPLHLVGRTVTHYRIIEALGSGGMGVVYRAEDTRLQRMIALKLLLPRYDLDPQAKARFVREARTLGALDHPNVCAVYDAGESDDGLLFLAMPWYQGETLRERIAREPALRVDEVRDIAMQIVRGLGCAHAAGLIHRDLKPANVMLIAGETVRILDFGLAKVRDASASDAGTLAGTIAYMAPEQLRGGRIDARVDLWSVGVILREMLSGARSHGGALSAGDTHLAGAPARSERSLSLSLRAGTDRLLQAEPDRRYQSAPELLAALSSDAAAPPASALRPRAWLAATALGALLLAGAVTILITRKGSTPEATVAAVAAPDPVVSRSSVAVLPLKSHSADVSQEYLAEGVTDELTSALSKVQALRVIAHQSVAQFKNSAMPVPEIARLLGVANVVDGSVAQDSNHIWITVALIDAQRNAPIWSDRFERDRSHVMALQHDVAMAIAKAIEIKLTPGDLERLGPVSDVNPAAFTEYLKGTQARNAVPSSSDMAAAARHLERSIELDSTYAPAYTGLALVRTAEGDTSAARRLTERALQLDPMQAEAHVVRAMILQVYDWDWAGSERELREAIRLNPGLAEAHHELSELLMRRRRFNDAIPEAQLALYLAPMSARFETGLGEIYFYGGQYDAAANAATQALAVDSTYVAPYFLRAQILMAEKKWPEALKAWTRLSELGCDCPGGRAYIHAMMGERSRAESILDTVIARWPAREKSPEATETAFAIATVLVGLQRRAEAMDWLERGVRHTGWTLYLSIDPTYAPLREEPRFKALLKRVRQS